MIAALLSALACRCGQPAVIGQILTGVLLGPSLLGRLPGHLTAHLFPPAVLPSLTSLAQVAVVTFMFTVGYELDSGAMRQHGRAVPMVATAALALPMGLGLAGTTPGAIATAAARTMDVLAWLVLVAALIGTSQSVRFSWPVTLLLTGGFVAAMLTVVPACRSTSATSTAPRSSCWA